MKKIIILHLTLLLFLSRAVSFGQVVLEDLHFKLDKTKNASLKIADLSENLELKAPGQPITVHKFLMKVNIDGKEKSFESNGSKVGKKVVDAILSAKEKPTHIDFSNVSFTQSDDDAKQVIKGFTIFLKKEGD